MIDIDDIIGLTGVALSLGCYGVLQWRRDFAKSLSYSALNLLASILFEWAILQHWNLAAFINNTCWGIFSLYGIYRCLKYIRRERKQAALAATVTR
jgi:hypothetical protein